MLVSMKNPKIGEIKEVKVGFSWILFLFSGFFGFFWFATFFKKALCLGVVYFWLFGLFI